MTFNGSSAAKAAILRATGLEKSYHSAAEDLKVIEAFSLDLLPGEIVALRGASGSGKSTLLNILGLADTPDAGELSLDGQLVDWSDQDQLRELRATKIGYIFQNFNLLSSLTALENVALPLMINGHSARESDAKAEELLESLGLSHRLSHRPSQLSGGEQQRVAIARAVIHQPVLLLADEPTGSLDLASGDAVLELLQSVVKQTGCALLLATHSNHASEIASRQIRME